MSHYETMPKTEEFRLFLSRLWDHITNQVDPATGTVRWPPELSDELKKQFVEFTRRDPVISPPVASSPPSGRLRCDVCDDTQIMSSAIQRGAPCLKSLGQPGCAGRYRDA